MNKIGTNVLDLRNKISSYYNSRDDKDAAFKYHIDQNKDRLEQIEILLFNCQVAEHTAKGFYNLLELLPNLKYIDLGSDSKNSSASSIMADAIKYAINRNIIIDMRRASPNIRNRLIDFEHEKLYKKGKHYFRLKCNDCKTINTYEGFYRSCDLCEKLQEVGSDIWNIIYKSRSEIKTTKDSIVKITSDINDIIDRVPGYVVDELYTYLINDNVHRDINPDYPFDKITKFTVENALIKYLKEFSITLTDDKVWVNHYEGVVFSLFDLGDHGDIGDMFGWKSLFKNDAWNLCLDYVECEKLYSLIKFDISSN